MSGLAKSEVSAEGWLGAHVATVRPRSLGELADPLWWLLPVIVGGAIRFATLVHQSFWGDEAATLAVLHHSLGSLLHAVRSSESTPPLYYYLAWLWVHVFGFGEAGVRSLSAVFGTATIVAVALIVRRFWGVRAGAAAAWVVATNPVLFWFSQEARAYGLFALLSAVSVGMMMALRVRPSRRKLAVWTVVCVAAAATHYFAAFLLGAELCVLLAWPGASLGRPMLLWPATAFVAAAVPLALLAHVQYGNSGFVQGHSLSSAITQTAGQLLVGYGVDPIMVVCAVAIAVGLAVSLWPLVRRSHRPPANLAQLALVLGLAAAAPLVVALAGTRVIDSRNMIYVLPTLAILAAATAERRWAVFLPVLAGLAVIVHVQFDPTLQRTNFRGVAAAIGPAHGSRAIIVEMSGTVALWPYMPGLRPMPAGGTRLDEILLVGMTMSGGLNRNVEPLTDLRFAPPGGFRQVETRTTQTFTLRRYEATRPTFANVGGLLQRPHG
jgi:4-amino-4-deoxy-L-arabinose transferase-like glycosyltransferase